MPDQRAAEYREKADECPLEARHTFKEADRAQWLTMAEEWLKLAQSVESPIVIAPSAKDGEARQNSNGEATETPPAAFSCVNSTLTIPRSPAGELFRLLSF
jgi:hypothetical protein